MKRILFILCCCVAAGIVVFMLVQAKEWFLTHNWINNAIYVLAIVGWVIITYKIINKKYKWTQKFFEE